MFFLFQVRCVLLVVHGSRRRDISIQVSDAGRDALCDHRLHRAREQALQFSPFWRRAGYVLLIPLKKTYKRYHVKNVKCLKKISDALRIVDVFFDFSHSCECSGNAVVLGLASSASSSASFLKLLCL